MRYWESLHRPTYLGDLVHMLKERKDVVLLRLCLPDVIGASFSLRSIDCAMGGNFEAIVVPVAMPNLQVTEIRCLRAFIDHNRVGHIFITYPNGYCAVTEYNRYKCLNESHPEHVCVLHNHDISAWLHEV